MAEMILKVNSKTHTIDADPKMSLLWAIRDRVGLTGWYVNPDIIKAQVEGSIVMALGAATEHETLFKDGKAVQKNFDSYKMPRIADIPEIEVHIMDNEEKAGGVGEPSPHRSVQP